MIDQALSLLKEELNSFISVKGDPATVLVDNIGLFETANGNSLNENIVLTLVNIEEESALKNQSNIKYFPPRNAIYQNPPVYLNLYVLITCSYFGEHYILALKRLSLVIQFIQSKNSFSYKSSVAVSKDSLSTGSPGTDIDLLDLKFTLELYTLTFEQINHLWGSLGGRQQPFAMYKLRMVGITERRILRETPVIEEIDINLS